MTKHFITSDGIKIDGFENANDFNKALKEWEEKQAELNKPMEKRMNRHLQEDYEYHQNAKWDHIQQLTKEHHDPFAGEEMTEKEIKELIEQAKKDEEVA